jgi:hypothetical protein
MNRVVEMFGVRMDDGTTRYTEAHGTEARVMHLIAKRQEAGMAKYGCSVRDNPLVLRQWLNHALEESLDMAVYLMRCIEEIDRNAEDGK